MPVKFSIKDSVSKVADKAKQTVDKTTSDVSDFTDRVTEQAADKAKKTFQETTANISDFTGQVADKIFDKAKKAVQETATNIVDNVAAEINSFNDELNRKNLEKMNRIRLNSAHFSDAQLRERINNISLDKYERIGYAAAFADRYSER